MKKIAVILATAMIVLGTITAAKASFMSASQRFYFQYYTYAYYGFIHDYATGLQESNTGGLISYNTSLSYSAQYPVSITTHVAYIYDSGAMRYVEAMACLDRNL